MRWMNSSEIVEVETTEWAFDQDTIDDDDTSEAEITTDDLPDWLQDIPQETSAPISETEPEPDLQPEPEGEVIPDWMHDISKEVPSIAGESEIEPEAEPEVEDIPDWLQDIAEEQTPETEEETPVDEAAVDELKIPEFEDADAAMAWMESLAAKQGVSEDELLTSPEERSDTPPEWVQDAVSAEAELSCRN